MKNFAGEYLTKLANEKIAIVGPALDLANLGIPSALGYYMGSHVGRDLAENKEARPEFGLDSLLALALMPGATGYQLGKRKGWDVRHKRHQHA